jgi:hypothetical protein
MWLLSVACAASPPMAGPSQLTAEEIAPWRAVENEPAAARQYPDGTARASQQPQEPSGSAESGTSEVEIGFIRRT